MSLTSHLALKPNPRSALVRPVFYGGLRDGHVGYPVPSGELLGAIRHPGGVGRYELIGFSSSFDDDDPLQEFRMDDAIYEWTT